MASDRPLGMRAHAKQSDLAILNANQAVSLGNHPLVVGGKNERCLELAVDPLHQKQDFLAGLVIEVRRRFIRQHNRRLNDQCPGDGDPLTLPTTQLIRAMTGVFRQANDIKEVGYSPLTLLARNIPAVKQRILDVFGG